MAKRRRTKSSMRGKVLVISRTQTGVSVRKVDSKREAMLPGKRLSRNKKIYYERRRNRSDKHPKNKSHL